MKLKNTTISEDLERWIEAYLKHIQALSYSNNTFLLYRRILLELVEYLLEYQDEMQINDIKTTFLVNFINYLEKMAINYQKNKNNLFESIN
ncbi:site-specific integrase [Campylobacter jejuni]|nr:site-specific integrase [Campylobacter jejuni]MCW1313970.1 site-specific integrase [Campylobacter jejuni]